MKILEWEGRRLARVFDIDASWLGILFMAAGIILFLLTAQRF